jgi:hypothetical protein
MTLELVPNPSGGGQTTKAKSMSVVFASDQDAAPVKSPDHSTDATFALAIWVGTVGVGSGVAVDAAPNTTEPSTDRILRITAKRDGVMTFGGAAIKTVTAGDGTSLLVQPWFYDDTQHLWIKHGPVITITTATTNISTLTIGNMAGAKFFIQVTTNNGGVTAFGYDVV